jgi:hypothetical protein
MAEPDQADRAVIYSKLTTNQLLAMLVVTLQETNKTTNNMLAALGYIQAEVDWIKNVALGPDRAFRVSDPVSVVNYRDSERGEQPLKVSGR